MAATFASATSCKPIWCNFVRSGTAGGFCASVDETTMSRDLLSIISENDEESLSEQGQAFAHRYALTDEQGVRLARTFRDYASLERRTEADWADFAQRLYGVNPNEIADAIAQNQLGNSTQMNELITRAATHFGTDAGTMKDMIRDLHGAALREYGVELE